MLLDSLAEVMKTTFIVFFQGEFSRDKILKICAGYGANVYSVPDSEEERMEKEIQTITRLLPLNLHTNIFTETDFKHMKNSKEITVGSEAMKNNIILHGIETYYEMIQ